MAVALPLKFSTIHSPFRITTNSSNSQFKPIVIQINTRSRQTAPSSKLYVTKAIEEGRKETQSETSSLIEETGAEPPNVEVSEVGREIQKAMEERKEKSANDLLSGVLEEVREIEWPAFQKVLGTTGVVLGVIAGSSVVLLTVNAVLAELSDKVFAGKGIQDFFS
ncbi:hypothetical protein QQ045_007721 [Rhodiola kirilowii]